MSKTYGEALGRYYRNLHNLLVVSLRIGTFRPGLTPKGCLANDRLFATWLSDRDLVHLVDCALTAPAKKITTGIYYGISDNENAIWSIQNARDELGYNPKDKAGDYL